MTNFTKYEYQRIARKLMLKDYPHGVWNILTDETKRAYYKLAIDAVDETVLILTEKGKVK